MENTQLPEFEEAWADMLVGGPDWTDTRIHIKNTYESWRKIRNTFPDITIEKTIKAIKALEKLEHCPWYDTAAVIHSESDGPWVKASSIGDYKEF